MPDIHKVSLHTRQGKPPTDHEGADNPDSLPLLRTSERKSFKRCPQRWQWGWRDGLKIIGPPNDKLWFGTGWHLVMAHIYGKPGFKRGKQPLKTWRDWVGDEMKEIRINLTGTDEYRQEIYVDAAKLGEHMIGNYLEWAKVADRYIDMIQVEKPFEVVLTDSEGTKRVLFCGTYDGVYRDARTDRFWLLEHKTAKAITTNHLELDDQAGGYLAVAARELAHAGLIPKGKEIAGVMYNFARKAMADERPVDEQGRCLNKDGSVSKNQPKPLFQRHEVRRTKRERNAQIQHMQAEVEHMDTMRYGELPLYKNPTRDCSWDCEFYTMCKLHELGGNDWQEYRDSVFKVKDPYADHRKSADGE